MVFALKFSILKTNLTIRTRFDAPLSISQHCAESPLHILQPRGTWPAIALTTRDVLLRNPPFEDRAVGSRLALGQSGAQTIENAHTTVKYREQRERNRRSRYGADGSTPQWTTPFGRRTNLQPKSKISSR